MASVRTLSLHGAAPLRLVFPFSGGLNILIFCLFVYCYGSRSKETKGVENIDQSSDLYKVKKTAVQMHIHMHTVPILIVSNILADNEVWNICKCWTDQTQN